MYMCSGVHAWRACLVACPLSLVLQVRLVNVFCPILVVVPVACYCCFRPQTFVPRVVSATPYLHVVMHTCPTGLSGLRTLVFSGSVYVHVHVSVYVIRMSMPSVCRMSSSLMRVFAPWKLQARSQRQARSRFQFDTTQPAFASMSKSKTPATRPSRRIHPTYTYAIRSGSDYQELDPESRVSRCGITARRAIGPLSMRHFSFSFSFQLHLSTSGLGLPGISRHRHRHRHGGHPQLNIIIPRSSTPRSPLGCGQRGGRCIVVVQHLS